MVEKAREETTKELVDESKVLGKEEHEATPLSEWKFCLDLQACGLRILTHRAYSARSDPHLALLLPHFKLALASSPRLVISDAQIGKYYGVTSIHEYRIRSPSLLISRGNPSFVERPTLKAFLATGYVPIMSGTFLFQNHSKILLTYF